MSEHSAAPADHRPPSRAVLEQAAQWFVVLASGESSDDERCRWQAWRMAHPSHELAWQRVEAATGRFSGLPPGQAAAMLSALGPGAGPGSGPASRGRRQALGRLVVLLAAGMAGWQGYRRSDWSADLRSAVGQQRDTLLADGSRLLLDTDSLVDVDFSAATRLIRLRRGRIMIATAPDPAPRYRPLLVETAQGRVVALGTRFTVEQQPASTRVAVLEARVALRCANGQGDGILLDAGQIARFDRDALIEQRAAPIADAAWTNGMLVADDMGLGDLLAELARYRAEPLACDPAAAELRISGAFPLRDTERALAALAATLPIRVERQGGAGEAGLIVRHR